MAAIRFYAICLGLSSSGSSASKIRADDNRVKHSVSDVRGAVIISEDAVIDYSSSIVPPSSNLMRRIEIDTHRNGRSKKEISRDVVVCRGIGDMSMTQFKELNEVWNKYASEKIITATSTLLYKISDNGEFKPFADPKRADMDFEQITKDYLSPQGTKALPHVWCDASCCKNCNLPTALQSAMKRPEAFFAESVAAAKKFGWHGYALDFEGSTGDSVKLTKFFKGWATELAKHHGPSGDPLELHLWTGSGADVDALSDVMTSIVDMGNYYNSHFYDKLGGTEQENEKQQAANWRRMRARSLLQTNGKSSICPASDAMLANHHNLLEESTLNYKKLDAQAVLAGINLNMDACSEGYKQKCALGLITYDLPNQGLNCDDMLRVGHKATRNEVQSLWIWSGGLMSSNWHVGLAHYVEGKSDYVSDADNQTLCKSELMLRQDADLSRKCSKCLFDGQFCCDGSFRHPERFHDQ